MSVVIIRESSRPRIRALAAKMGWELRKARGCAWGLWEESQALKSWCASREEILFWSDEHDPQVGEKLLAVLQDPLVKLIAPMNGNTFEILGNRDEIDKVSRVVKARQKAANARWHQGADSGGVECKDDANASACADVMQCGSYDYAMPQLNQAKPSQAKLDTPPPKSRTP